jgi:RND family efflux transporter MFP subunit
MIRSKTHALCAAATACALVAAGGLALVAPVRGQVAGAGVPQVSALVRTEPLRRQELPRRLDALGEVATGTVEGVNFPTAGQVAKLLVTLGQPVRRGAPLVVLGADPAAQLAYAQAGSAVDFARAELRRNEELYALQLATAAQVDAARRALRDAEATLAAQRKLGGEAAQATVRAPFDGVITAIAVAQGDRVQPGAQILQLGRAEALRVLLGIEPDERALVRVGMAVTIATLQGSQQSARGTVAMVQDIVDPKSRLVSVVVDVPRTAGAGFLIPGMHVRAAIELGKLNAWVVPRDAVLGDAGGAYLYQVADGKARRVAVRQVLQAGLVVAVESSALDAAQPVVVLGNYALHDGMRVRENAQ